MTDRRRPRCGTHSIVAIFLAAAALAGCAGGPRPEPVTDHPVREVPPPRLADHRPPHLPETRLPGPDPPSPAETVYESGVASFYGRKFQGRRTASGERFDMNDLTAAHRELPFGTRVRVINMENGRSIVVRVNDRGPFVDGRVIDVSRRAAGELGFIHHGLARVQLILVH